MTTAMPLRTRTLSSLEKVFPDETPNASPLTRATMLKNESFSFQIAYRTESLERGIRVEIESPLAPFARVYDVGLAPSEYPVPADHDGDVLRAAPGLFPDPLFPYDPAEGLVGLPGQWRSVWISIEPESRAAAGVHPVVVRFRSKDGAAIAEASIELDVVDAELPDQRLLVTNWFHADCLATHYGVPPFSEPHWELIGRYVETAVRHGMNTMLTPLFTPPLDTAVGGERPTVQLVDVAIDGDGYRFGFDRLERWIGLCRDKGVRVFECAHLFTQWGAKHAPKIVATEADGSERRLFGWDTDASGEPYRAFLAAFLPALTDEFRRLGVERDVLFHVSDEPSLDHLESYRNARSAIEPYVKGFPIIDALSDYEFYERGLVPHPVPSTDHIEPFLANGVAGLWTYYCCGQYKGVANRFFAFPSYRNRVLGVQLYKHDLAGFLHWGYNFWYSGLSRKRLNPYVSTDADRYFPSGDAFVVYPGEDGAPVESIRLKVFREALQDERALRLLESLEGRDAATAAATDDGRTPLAFAEYPRSADWLLGVRERINRDIRNALERRRARD